MGFCCNCHSGGCSCADYRIGASAEDWFRIDLDRHIHRRAFALIWLGQNIEITIRITYFEQEVADHTSGHIAGQGSYQGTLVESLDVLAENLDSSS